MPKKRNPPPMFNPWEAKDNLGYGREAAAGFLQVMTLDDPNRALCSDVIAAIDRLGYAVTGEPDPFKAQAKRQNHSCGGGAYRIE